jgi:ATP-binding cassette, subfamily C, bacterial
MERRNDGFPFRMKQVLRIFFGAEDTRPFVVLACLVLAGLAEAAGISTLLPAATSLVGEQQGSSWLNGAVLNTIRSLGIAPSLGNLIVIVSGLQILRAALSFGALTYAGLTAAKVAVGMRRRLIKAIFDARWSFYQNQSTGRLANAISNDATRAGAAYTLAANAVAYAVQTAGYVAVGFVIDWRLALVGFAAGLAIAAVTSVLVTAAKKQGDKQTDRTSDLTVYMVDMLANIKGLKTMDRYGALLASLASTLRRLKRSLVRQQFAQQGLMQGLDAMVAVLIGAGVYLAHNYFGTPLPELIVGGLIFYQILAAVARLQRMTQNAALIESAYLRNEALIGEAQAQVESHAGRGAPEVGSGCRFEGVSFSHGNTPIVSNVTLDIPANAITVLQGPSGAGKTTLIDLLIGLHRPAKGSIYVGRDRLDDIDIKAWRQSIGYVPQELNLLHASIRDNIAFGDGAVNDAKIEAALKQAGADEFVAQLREGLDANVGEMGGKLSGGQRQRISLARALVHDPKLLILDEVTSALDPESEAAIVGRIAALRGKYTIIAITHRPAWTDIADKLYKVARGRVSEIKRPAKGKRR